jgi:hypothetical protein
MKFPRKDSIRWRLTACAKSRTWGWPLGRLSRWLKRKISQTSTALWFAWEVRLSQTATRNSPTSETEIRRRHPGPTRPQLSRPSSGVQNGSGETCDSRTDIPVASHLASILYDLMLSSWSFRSRLVTFRALKILTDSPCDIKHTTSKRSLAECPIIIFRCSSIE